MYTYLLKENVKRTQEKHRTKKTHFTVVFISYINICMKLSQYEFTLSGFTVNILNRNFIVQFDYIYIIYIYKDSINFLSTGFRIKDYSGRKITF